MAILSKLILLTAVAVMLIGCKPTQAVANQNLHMACETKNLADARRALEQGADPNAPCCTEGQQRLPLEVAAPSPEIVEALIKTGAIPKKADTQGLLPLGMAAASGPPRSLELILKAGAILESKDADGETALGHAAGALNLENVKFLIDCGANVNAKDRLGFTPLFHAVTAPEGRSEDRTEVVRLLVEHGANIRLRDTKGRTAFAYADSDLSRRQGASQALLDLLSTPNPKAE